MQQRLEVSQTQSGQDILSATPSLSTPATPVDWQSYPYNSSNPLRCCLRHRYTLENRANKVKEQVLGCGTSNELISLHAEGKVSEPEILWIKTNYLNESELKQLADTSATRQGNLFSENDGETELANWKEKAGEPTQIEWQQVMDDIDREMERLGWDKQTGKKHLIDTYGVKSRLYLTDAQLIEFCNYLKNI